MSSDFKLEPISRLWKLALPLIIANIATPLLSLADAAIAGHLDHSYYLASVTLGAELLIIFFGTFSFLRMGTTGLVAQSVGANQQTQTVRILLHAMLLALGLGFLLFFTGAQMIEPLLKFTAPATEMVGPLTQYLETRLWGAPAHLALFALTGWFIGQGLTRIALYLAVGINLLNIALNFLFAIELQMNSFGIALGTVLSEYIGMVVAIVLVFNRHRAIEIRPLWRLSLVVDLLKINTPLMIRTIALHSVFVTLSIFAARIGTTEAASIGLILVLLATAAYALDGFAYASEIEAGQAMGERKYERFKDSLWAGSILSVCSASLLAGIALIFHSQIFTVLTTFESVSLQASSLMGWFPWILFILSWSYWLDGVFIGVTKTLDMCLAMCTATSLGWFGSLWVLGTDSLSHLMAAFLIFSAIRTITLGLRLPAIIQQIRHLSV